MKLAFDQMQSQAKSLGKTIVTKEQHLSDAFASKNITTTKLEKETRDLAQLYGKLRTTHLQAHLQINQLLFSQEIKKCNQIRGYEIER